MKNLERRTEDSQLYEALQYICESYSVFLYSRAKVNKYYLIFIFIWTFSIWLCLDCQISVEDLKIIAGPEIAELIPQPHLGCRVQFIHGLSKWKQKLVSIAINEKMNVKYVNKYIYFRNCLLNVHVVVKNK